MSDVESQRPPEPDSFSPSADAKGSGQVHSTDKPGSRKTVALVALLIVGCIAWGLVQAVLSAREAANSASCNCRLKQLGLALHNYHSVNGCFPPAYTVDDQGRRMHSWRALLLPYFEAGTSLANYDLNEPWDGPNNRKLWDQMPPIFGCPSDDSSSPNTTNYVAIVGPTTMWPGGKSVATADITDGLSNTIAIVEAKNLAVPWLEPRDLEEESLSMVINDKATTNALSSDHPLGVNVLMADGSVKFLMRGLDTKLLKGLLTIAGGEPVSLPGH